MKLIPRVAAGLLLAGMLVPVQQAQAADPAQPSWRDKWLQVTADPLVPIEKIAMAVVMRTDLKPVWRGDGRGPDKIFVEGFRPRNTTMLDYFHFTRGDLSGNVWPQSAFVSTSYDEEIAKAFAKKNSGWWYEIHTPNGIDVNVSLGANSRNASEREAAFPGGVQLRYIKQGCHYVEPDPEPVCEANKAFVEPTGDEAIQDIWTDPVDLDQLRPDLGWRDSDDPLWSVPFSGGGAFNKEPAAAFKDGLSFPEAFRGNTNIVTDYLGKYGNAPSAFIAGTPHQKDALSSVPRDGEAWLYEMTPPGGIHINDGMGSFLNPYWAGQEGRVLLPGGTVGKWLKRGCLFKWEATTPVRCEDNPGWAGHSEVTVEFKLDQDSASYQGTFTIKNKGNTTVKDWHLVFRMPLQVTVGNAWGDGVLITPNKKQGGELISIKAPSWAGEKKDLDGGGVRTVTVSGDRPSTAVPVDPYDKEVISKPAS